MRNGNFLLPPLNFCFLLVLILPMRNGNPFSDGNSKPPILPVLILPMRNGNTLLSLCKNQLKNRSYPTYEEWKQISYSKIRFSIYSSYPTYEEWKQPKISEISKLERVLILPMRNGNPHLFLQSSALLSFLSYL